MSADPFVLHVAKVSFEDAPDISCDGKLLAVALKMHTPGVGNILLCEIDKGTLCNVSGLETDDKSEMWQVAFSPVDANMLATVSSKTYTCLWNVHKRECFARFLDTCHVAFSPDGEVIACATRNNLLKLFSVANKTLVLQLNHNDVKGATFSPDGTMLASACSNVIQLWNYPSGTLQAVLDGMENMYSITFSPGSDLLAMSGFGGQIVLWDTRTKIFQSAEINAPYVNSLTFSPDGRRLVCRSNTGEVFQCKVVDKKLIPFKYIVYTNRIRGVVFHPNNKQLVSVSFYEKLHLLAICPWSDRTHYLFGPILKKQVFQLMCVRQRLLLLDLPAFPHLPMEMWLVIFAHLAL